MNKRQKGYYWVKLRRSGELAIAEWTGDVWYLTRIEPFFHDEAFLEINEKRIMPPSAGRVDRVVVDTTTILKMG